MLSVEFIARFVNTLGNVSEWEHNGVVNDRGNPSGHCVCGHPIRYEFEIVNKVNGKTSSVGSECINHFKEYSVELYNSLKATVEKQKAKMTEAKKALLEGEVAKLKVIADEMKTAIIYEFNYQSNFGAKFVDRNLWEAKCDCECRVKEYKTITGYKKFYEKEVARLTAICSKFGITSQDIAKAVETKIAQTILFTENTSMAEELKPVLETINASRLNKYFEIKMRISHTFEQSYEDNLAIKKEMISIKSGNIPVEKTLVRATGKTYPVKDILKASGFNWNALAKCWEIYTTEVNFPELAGVQYIAV